MRALVVILVVLTSTHAAAKPKKSRVAITVPGYDARAERTRGQSIGAPWSGRLRDATRLRSGDRYHIRRPHRAFGTRTTVEHTRAAITSTLEQFPNLHVLAIGDLSARHGGWISEHGSHQSGRDVDLGLFYKQQPSGYPASFVNATSKTLHTAAMWALISRLVRTENRDGGVKMMFLDFELQGVIYRWAKANGVSTKRLDRIFQYPHGRGAAAGIVRHEPNHADHLHVRFHCAVTDVRCR